jgi:hypothetical protein
VFTRELRYRHPPSHREAPPPRSDEGPRHSRRPTLRLPLLFGAPVPGARALLHVEIRRREARCGYAPCGSVRCCTPRVKAAWLLPPAGVSYLVGVRSTRVT